MTDKPTQETQAPEATPTAPAAAPQENIMSKVAGGFSWWIGSLTGKPRAPKPAAPAAAPAAPAAQATPAQTIPNQPKAPPTPTAAPIAGGESGAGDSVTQDVEALKKFVGKISENVGKTVAPVVIKGATASSQKASSAGKKMIDTGFMKKLLKIFFVILFLMAIAFVAMKLFKSAPPIQIGKKPSPTPVASSTPTPIVYHPTKPSVYAEDPVTLKLEQDINVLTREISGTNIKETQLNPPVLDFNVTF